MQDDHQGDIEPSARYLIFNMKNKDLYLPYIIMAALCIIALFCGRCFDLNIARSVYSENLMPAVIISVVGLYLYYGSLAFFLGVLCRQLINATKKPICTVLLLILYSCFAFSTSIYFAVALCSDSVCGFILPGSIPRYVITGLILLFPLFPIGMLKNGRRCDRKVIRDLMILLTVMTVAVIVSNITKRSVMRPRYRITLQGFDGLGFVPVFSRLKDGKDLIAKYGLVSDDIASFFSGHAMNAIMGIIIYPAYAYVFESLKWKERFLSYAAVIITIPIAFSRIVLGDHYLSDVATGALVGLSFCLITCHHLRYMRK